MEPDNKEVAAKLKQCHDFIRAHAFEEQPAAPLRRSAGRGAATPASATNGQLSSSSHKGKEKETNANVKDKEKETQNDNTMEVLLPNFNRVPPPWATPLNAIPKLTELAIRSICTEVTVHTPLYLEALKTGDV